MELVRQGLVAYAVRKQSKNTVSMAVEIAKRHSVWVPDHEVDHLDGDSLNNQRANLRPASGSQNQANQVHRTGGSSKYKGVYWYKTQGCWRATIRYQYKKYYLGSYSSEEEAARAYDARAFEFFGEYARLNFPQ